MITVIAGYPASGKTTLARELAKKDGAAVVVDLDAITAALIGMDPHTKPASQRRLALAVNEIFWELAESLDRHGLQVYAIRTAPGAVEWETHVRYCARIFLRRDKTACRADAAMREDFDHENFEAACAAVDRMPKNRWQIQERG